MLIPRAQAHQILCGSSDDIKCLDDGTIRIDVSAGSAMSTSCCAFVQHVYVFGLDGIQTIPVEREWKDPCDPIWKPWETCRKEVVLTCDCPETILTVPGRYRLVLPQECADPLDPEHVRIQVTKMPVEQAALRLSQIANGI